MITRKLLGLYVLTFGFMVVTFSSCSNEDSNTDIQEQNLEENELKRASEIDVIGETIGDIIIDAYEAEEDNTLDRLASATQASIIPACVSITVIAEQGFREVTLDFGTQGCVINGHLLRGQIIFSYTRNFENPQVLITYNLVDFFFDAKSVIGSRTILRELSNDNGNPQFTHTLDFTVTWPNGVTASRTGLKMREWIEGFQSGVFSDNVFEVNGNWTTTFVNGNEHSYEVLTPLRREVTCSHFVSGTVDVQRSNFGGTFNYGNGDCDGQATFTFNDGTEIDIVLN